MTQVHDTQRGSLNHRAKLTEADVVAIRSHYASGATQPALAAVYGVNKRVIWKIVHRLNWRHV